MTLEESERARLSYFFREFAESLQREMDLLEAARKRFAAKAAVVSADKSERDLAELAEEINQRSEDVYRRSGRSFAGKRYRRLG